jgi:predicted transglutaminase-like cysteine proteinase
VNLPQVLLGLAGLALGVRTVRRGVSELSAGLQSRPTSLSGHGEVEPDPRGRGSIGRRVGTVNRGKAGFSDVREVESLDERINAIRDRIRKGRVDPKVIAWARAQVSKKCPGRPGGWCVPEKDTEAEIRAIFNGMRRDVRYTSDVLGVDTYVHPRKTLEQRSGDCDDYSALGCSALMSVGIPCRLKVIRTKDSQTWNHIYIQAGHPKGAPDKWMTLDASVPVRPGWEVPASMVAASRTFEVAW